MSSLSRYAFTVGRTLRLLTLGPLTASGRAELAGLSDSLGWMRHAGSLPEVRIEAIVRPGPIELVGLDAAVWNTTTTELTVIALVARRVAPRRIFEFGTYDGRAGATMLLNASANACLWTIDLPMDARDPSQSLTETGIRLRDSDVEPRVVGRYTQLLADTLSYDYVDHLGRTDLIFVDAGHSYECCLSDSRNAVRMLAPGGVILWHDYATIHPGVTKAVDEVARDGRPGCRFARVAGTSIAVCAPDAMLGTATSS